MKNINEKPTFRDWLKESVEEGRQATYRADPILSNTDTTVIEKQVFAGVDVLTSPGEAFLRQLGVTFYPGLVGNFVVPSMAESTAKFVTETQNASTANLATTSITLAARRVSHTQSISKETLAQTSPAIYNSIVQNLVDGLWNCVTNDLFDQVRADCTSTNEVNILTTSLNFTHLVNMEASIGGLMLAKPAYVTTPAVGAYLKTLPKLTNQVGVYEDDKINGYPAYAVPAQNANVVTFGDWSRACVGQWGPISIIVDPFTSAKSGLINLTIEGLFDTGVYNKLGFTNRIDVSAGR
jgi:hypothetical protein